MTEFLDIHFSKGWWKTALLDLPISVLQCIAMYCSVFHCVSVCCRSVFAMCCSVLQCVAKYCDVLQCLPLCFSVVKPIAFGMSCLQSQNWIDWVVSASLLSRSVGKPQLDWDWRIWLNDTPNAMLKYSWPANQISNGSQCVSMCRSILQCVAVYYSVSGHHLSMTSQCVAVRCSVLQCVA